MVSSARAAERASCSLDAWIGLRAVRKLELPSWEAVKRAVAQSGGIAAISPARSTSSSRPRRWPYLTFRAGASRAQSPPSPPATPPSHRRPSDSCRCREKASAGLAQRRAYASETPAWNPAPAGAPRCRDGVESRLRKGVLAAASGRVWRCSTGPPQPALSASPLRSWVRLQRRFKSSRPHSPSQRRRRMRRRSHPRRRIAGWKAATIREPPS